MLLASKQPILQILMRQTLISLNLQSFTAWLRNGLILMLLACAPLYAQDTKVVEIEKVTRKNIIQTVRLIGTVKAKRATTFIAKTQGTLQHHIPAGHHVKKGAVLATLENSELEKSYALTLDSVKIAKIQYERLLPLAKSHVISKQALEEKKAQWIDAQKRLSLAKIDLDKSRFIAPFDGIVGVYKITPGSQVAEGESIVTLYDPTDVMVEFDIPGSLLHQLKDGQQVYVNGKTFPLTHVQKMIDPQTHMSCASVHFSCKNCFIGETVDVDLALAEHRNVIVIPTEALFLKNGKSFVYTVVDNKVTLKPVILGIREKEMVEIIDGIQTGEQLILRGQARLYPNAPVKIHPPIQLAKVTT